MRPSGAALARRAAEKKGDARQPDAAPHTFLSRAVRWPRWGARSFSR